MKYTNNTEIPLTLAVWLLHDQYDYVVKPNYISVTSLMRPLKQIILAKRVDSSTQTIDLSELIASRLGTALHDSIERAWELNSDNALKMLGYPKSVRERVLINPTDKQLHGTKEAIPIYLEKRFYKEVDGWTIGGKFDMVAEGIPQDAKSTSAFSWLYGTRDDEHALQLSLYKWLKPSIITSDIGVINYIFTDWKKIDAASNPKYPQSRLESKVITLHEPAYIQNWVETKIKLLSSLMDSPESAMPPCTPDELWMSESKYKYFADPAKTTGRSTKNFDTLTEASAFQREKGKGVVITVPGEPKRCGYCPAFDVCKQKDTYFPT